MAKKKGTKKGGKSPKPPKRLRYKGRFITNELQERIRECKRELTKKDPKNKYITYKALINAYYKNLEVGIEDAKNYDADKFCDIHDMEEFTFTLVYYMFFSDFNKLSRRLGARPAIYITRFGATKEERVDVGALSLILNDLRDKLFDSWQKARAANEPVDDSPKWYYHVKVFVLAKKVFIDLNNIGGLDAYTEKYLRKEFGLK